MDDASPQQRIVMHADDVGMCHGANTAFVELSKHGSITAGSVMVPCPWFPEIAEVAASDSSLDVGVHLVLNAEQQHYRWRPLSNPSPAAGLTDDDGFFWSKVADVRANAHPEAVEEEWRAQLDDMAYFVLRKAGTEPQGSSELLNNKEKGTYVCAGCGTPLFASDYKYDSGSGWPSFDREVEGNVAFSIDTSFGMQRVEEHCAICGGHLGHVFDDGPRETTGKRHCINGAALEFVPSR